MSSDLAIRVEGVWKAFERGTDQGGISKTLSFLSKPDSHFWALQDVSFELKKGDALGVIGRNGAGKSTLLRIAANIMQPDKGSVILNVKPETIFALQSGFRPTATGRENVYLKGATMGLEKEQIDELYEDIVNFADIGHFIHAPLKTYSNGMRARLAFAIAFSLTPDFLIVDEGLAVGDNVFYRKCMLRLAELREAGVTLLFVTHGPGPLHALSDKAIFIDHGQRLDFGDAHRVFENYRIFINNPSEQRDALREQLLNADGAEITLGTTDLKPHHAARADKSTATESKDEYRTDLREEFKSHGATIQNVWIENMDKTRIHRPEKGGAYQFVFPIHIQQACANVWFKFRIRSLDDIDVYTAHSHEKEEAIPYIDHKKSMQVCFPVTLNLLAGRYFADLEVWGQIDGTSCLLHAWQNALLFSVSDETALVSGLADLTQEKICTIEFKD